MLQTDMLLIGLFHSQWPCSDKYVWFDERKKNALLLEHYEFKHFLSEDFYKHTNLN